MVSDEDYHRDYHRESEFYYPDETENYNEKENISSLHNENHQSAEFTMTAGAKVYLAQRTENTVRKTDLNLNSEKAFPFR